MWVETTVHTVVRVWRGDLGWNEAVARDRIRLQGPSSLCRQLPAWFQLSYFAGVPRAVHG